MEVFQLVERIKGRVADQMEDIPVPPVMEEVMVVVQEEEKLGHRNECNSGPSSKVCQCLKVWKRPLRL